MEVKTVGTERTCALHSLGHFEQVINVVLIALVSFRTPHEPQFENVVVSATLNDFIASIIAHVIVLVLLEQIVGTHLVRLNQEALYEIKSY